MTPMTPRAVMDLEHAYPGAVNDGRKTAAVRDTFGVSLTRYTQRLNQLLDDPAFIELDPVHARHLRARRAAGSRGRRLTSAA